MSRARKPRRGAHVKAGQPQNGLGMKCEHCGEVLKLPSPMEIRVWSATAKAFAHLHENCPPPKEKP